MNDDLAGLIESFADIGQPLGLIRVLRALAERIEQLEARVDDTRAVAVLHHAGCTRRDNDLRAELDNMRAAVMGEFEVLRGADLRDAE